MSEPPPTTPTSPKNRMSLVNMLNENEQINQDEQIVLQALGAIKNQPFFQRVSEIPLVNRTVSQISNVYENTKNSNGVLKYSAESVESVTKTITKPVLSTLGPVLTPLDRFACNQLDKVQRSFPSMASATDTPVDLLAPPSVPLPMTDHEAPYAYESYPDTGESNQKPSTWPKVVGSVGANLGVLSDETIKALRYCIQYLQYAISNMGHQISVLKHSLQNAAQATKDILSISTKPDGTPSSNLDNINVLISSVKREIVETIRRVVDMLGKYSSQYLPVDAKQNVRSFILNLPNRLQTVRPQTPLGIENRQQEAENVIMLANESRRMLENIETVISATVVSAEKTLGYKEPLTPKNSKEEIVMESVTNDGMDES